jgi:hypothetical protein
LGTLIKNLVILRSSKKPGFFDVTYYDMEHGDMTCMGVTVVTIFSINAWNSPHIYMGNQSVHE